MRTRKLLCGLIAVAMALTCAVPVLARRGGSLSYSYLENLDGKTTAAELINTEKDTMCAISDGNGDPINTVGAVNGFYSKFSDGHLTLEGVNPSQTLYIYLGPDHFKEDLSALFEDEDGNAPEFVIRSADLANENVMNLRTSISGDGKALVAGVSQYSSKAVGKMDRGSWLKVMLFDEAATDETKIEINATFTTRDASASDSFDGNAITGGFASQLRITLWLNNTKVSGDVGESENGDRVYYSPSSAGTNEFVWGNDRAALVFGADSDAGEFYCRMSDNVDNSVYYDYGNQVSAELYFFDFVTHPEIPSSGRATLTLGIPWSDDDDYRPDPATCRIYQQDVMGRLTDVTDLFTYSEDSEPIPGWSMRVRKLESYVISDVPLPVEEKADGYDDVYYYSDEDLDRIFAIDPALSLQIQTSYIGKTVQDRLLEILADGIGGADNRERVNAILGVETQTDSESESPLTPQ